LIEVSFQPCFIKLATLHIQYGNVDAFTQMFF